MRGKDLNLRPPGLLEKRARFSANTATIVLCGSRAQSTRGEFSGQASTRPSQRPTAPATDRVVPGNRLRTEIDRHPRSGDVSGYGTARSGIRHSWDRQVARAKCLPDAISFTEIAQLSCGALQSSVPNRCHLWCQNGAFSADRSVSSSGTR